MKRAVVMIGAVLLLAACGGSGRKDPTTDQIKAAYTGFFTEKGTLADHVALLENGQKFSSVLETFLSHPFVSGVSATVSSVKLEGPKRAKVVYTVKTAIGPLPDQPGYAVLQGGKWKVADETLCGLIKFTGSTPAVCNS